MIQPRDIFRNIILLLSSGENQEQRQKFVMFGGLLDLSDQ